MQLFDDRSKKRVRWWNANCYFAGTIFVVLANIIIFAFYNNWQANVFPIDNVVNSYEIVDIAPLLRGLFNSFSHVNWQHVLLNMLCFFVAGLYLERKTGTICLVLLVVATAFFSSCAMAAMSYYSHYTQGYSGVNYLLYAYIIIDYLFSFQKAKRNVFNILFGAVVVGLIYLAMCFNGGVSTIGFEVYPYDLINNLWHYSSFFAGIFFGLTVHITALKTRKEATQKGTEQLDDF